jgi:hypothetical protein
LVIFIFQVRGGRDAQNTKGRLINCVITQCGLSGIASGKNALIELEGDQTKVDGNATRGDGHHYGGGGSYYGLHTATSAPGSFDTSSTIHLLFPLTKESVSTNNNVGENRWGGNYGGNGTIQTVDALESL